MIVNRFVYLVTRKLILHSFFWIIVLIFFSYFLGTPNDDPFYTVSFSAFLLPVTMATTYTMIYYLIPQYLLPKKYLLFSLYSFYTLVLSAFAITISIFYSMVFLMDKNYPEMLPTSRSILFMMVVVYLVVVVVSAFVLLKKIYSSEAKNKTLNNKVLEAQLKLREQELRYLKMQVHPHFLFNTLNTLYGYALKKSEETPDMILKLSNLLDYLLYQVDKPLVSLSSEIDHIKDYIDLEKLRFRDTLFVIMDFPSVTVNIDIAPMLLIPFVENSFKHGEIIDGKLSIHIILQVDEERLLFTVKNSVNKWHKSGSQDGIGLKNLEKRLSLLYKDRHNFSVRKYGEFFEAQLILNHSKSYHHG